jgi:HEAT repeat protein
MFSKQLTGVLFVLIVPFGTDGWARQQPPSSAPASLPTAAPAPRAAGAMGVEEATAVTQGWALLAQGHIAAAAARAAQVLERYPRSAAALILAVEAEIARAGSPAGLGQYERWLGQRTIEEPGVVRRIALALLREHAAQSQHPSARLEALQSLAADGDADASAELTRAAGTGGTAETRALAALGNQQAVKTLLAQLATPGADKVAIIQALGRSGSRAATEPIAAHLQDRLPEVRGAAAEALGKLASSTAVSRQKPLLDDESSYVRVRAAAALFMTGDDAGLQVLQELSESSAAASRLIAVEAMATRPGPLWLQLVRQLTSSAEPEVRVSAARLVAPHDPELARAALEQLMQHENPVIRDLAFDAVTELPALDLAALRALMRDGSPLTRVRAAKRVLAMTR